MKCFTTYHPASVFYGGFQLEQYIISDLRRLRRKQLKSPKQDLPAASSRTIGFDSEYDPNGRLLTVGLADRNKAAALETNEKDWLKRTRKVINGSRILNGHSIAGDLDYLVKFGATKEKWLRGIDVRDSLLLARMYDENRGKGAYGLEQLFLAEFNFAPWKAETEKLLKKTGNASDWSPEQRVERCRMDAWATLVLAEYFERRLSESVRS